MWNGGVAIFYLIRSDLRGVSFQAGTADVRPSYHQRAWRRFGISIRPSRRPFACSLGRREAGKRGTKGSDSIDRIDFFIRSS